MLLPPTSFSNLSFWFWFTNDDLAPGEREQMRLICALTVLLYDSSLESVTVEMVLAET